MPAVASAATSVVIAHVAGGTSTIRVGAGGIMLPNHSPLVIAEQFGTLEVALPRPHRSRRGPRARQRPGDGGGAAAQPQHRLVSAGCPGAHGARSASPHRASASGRFLARDCTSRSGSSGSSLFGAQLAAELGLPFAFASHFAPAQMMAAIDIYRSQFSPADGRGRARAPAPDARRQRRRGRHRPGSAAALHLAPADLPRAAPRPARSGAAAGRSRSLRGGAHAARARWSCEHVLSIGDRRLARRPSQRGLSEFLDADRAPTSSSSPRRYSTMRRD